MSAYIQFTNRSKGASVVQRLIPNLHVGPPPIRAQTLVPVFGAAAIRVRSTVILAPVLHVKLQRLCRATVGNRLCPSVVHVWVRASAVPRLPRNSPAARSADAG